jgi:hypothetical protein
MPFIAFEIIEKQGVYGTNLALVLSLGFGVLKLLAGLFNWLHQIVLTCFFVCFGGYGGFKILSF